MFKRDIFLPIILRQLNSMKVTFKLKVLGKNMIQLFAKNTQLVLWNSLVALLILID